MKITKKFLTPMQLMSCGMMKLKKIGITERYNGSGSLLQLADIMAADNCKKVFIAVSNTVLECGTITGFTDTLKEENIEFVIYTVPNSNVDSESVEKGLVLYEENNCDSVAAIGGGTVIDCAKLIALRAANPSKNLHYIMDYTAVLKKSPPIYAAPTTLGSGAEISMIAFLTDSKGKKYPVLSSEYVPRAVSLDPDLTDTLPPTLIAYGGMSSLTRAIESYIGTFSERFYGDTQIAPKACRMIFENLLTAYKDPDNQTARLNLLKASHYAGVSFRRASGGYVYALANRFEELYGIPHGKSCAVLLPYLLEDYINDIKKDLSTFSYHCGFTQNKNAELENAFIFIEKIKELCHQLNIPDYIEEFRSEDTDLIVKRAQADARMTGTPKIFSDNELKSFLINTVYRKKAV